MFSPLVPPVVQAVESTGGALLPPELIVAAWRDTVSGGDLLTVLVGVGDLDRRNFPAQCFCVTGAILKGYIISGEELQGEVLRCRILLQGATVRNGGVLLLKFEIRIRETDCLEDLRVPTSLRSAVQNHLRTSPVVPEVHTKRGIVVIVNRAENIGIGLRFPLVLTREPI